MGYELTPAIRNGSIEIESEMFFGTGPTVQFSYSDWPLTLKLAEAYGWEPMGTAAPYDVHIEGDGAWEGDYCVNNLQTVTAHDALNLANALDKALEDDFARFDYEESEVNKEFWCEQIEDLLVLCRDGAFVIA